MIIHLPHIPALRLKAKTRNNSQKLLEIPMNFLKPPHYLRKICLSQQNSSTFWENSSVCAFQARKREKSTKLMIIKEEALDIQTRSWRIVLKLKKNK